MRRASILVLAAVFLVTACNAPPDANGYGDGGTAADGGGAGGGNGNGGGGGGGQGDGGTTSSGPCMAGQTQCAGTAYQVCQNGTWQTQATCSAPQVCANGIGCAACNPASGNTCKGNDVATCNSDGTIGSVTQTCGIQTCFQGKCVSNGCAAGTGLIYAVDEAGDLLSFNPAHNANTFKVLGQLKCNGGSSLPGYGGGQASPFSMSVDRQANAWILYSSGKIFKVPVSNTSSCTNSGWKSGTGGFQLMGMGFVSVSPGSQQERLYIAGGQAGSTANGHIGYIDPATLKETTVGSYSANTYGPELTGTGGAKLFGYFPGNPSKVTEIDPANGQQGQSWSLPSTSNVMAWAFAHWGGRFYIFVTEGSTPHVLLLDPTQNGKVTDITPSGDHYIVVGAGVSTCAPVQLPPP